MTDKFDHAIADLTGRFPGEKIEIVQLFDIAHVGWECDSRGALILRDGVPELVIIDQTGRDDRPVREILEAKVDEYEKLSSQTRNVLGQMMMLEGLPRRVIGVEELSDDEMDMIMRSRVDNTNPKNVEFDPDRDSAYHVAREGMRDRVATLSAQVARIENEIVDVGVEMGQLDSTDRDAIETTIAKYKTTGKTDDALDEILATARRLAPAVEHVFGSHNTDLEVLEKLVWMDRSRETWGEIRGHLDLEEPPNYGTEWSDRQRLERQLYTYAGYHRNMSDGELRSFVEGVRKAANDAHGGER